VVTNNNFMYVTRKASSSYHDVVVMSSCGCRRVTSRRHHVVDALPCCGVVTFWLVMWLRCVSYCHCVVVWFWCCGRIVVVWASLCWVGCHGRVAGWGSLLRRGHLTWSCVCLVVRSLLWSAVVSAGEG
jgi:hypothetical protein